MGQITHMNDWFYIFHFLTCILILMHVRRDCRILGEGWGKYVLLVLFFSWIFYFLWLFVWPGSLRLRLQGKRLADSAMARAVNRHRLAH